MTETPQEPAPQQPAPQQPAPAPAGPTAAEGAPKNSIALAGMILGVIAVATCWLVCAPYIPIVVGVVGLVLSVIGAKKAKEIGVGAGQAKTGLICSIIGIVVPVVLLILASVGCAMLGTWGKKVVEDAAKNLPTPPPAP